MPKDTTAKRSRCWEFTLSGSPDPDLPCTLMLICKYLDYYVQDDNITGFIQFAHSRAVSSQWLKGYQVTWTPVCQKYYDTLYPIKGLRRTKGTYIPSYTRVPSDKPKLVCPKKRKYDYIDIPGKKPVYSLLSKGNIKVTYDDITTV